MAQEIKTLVVGITFDPSIEDSDPLLLVAVGGRTDDEPCRIINSITGQKAIKIWNELNTFEEGDKNGGTRNASN